MLPVIPCAISLRLTIEGWPNGQQVIHVGLPDIQGRVTLPLDRPIVYEHRRDYLRSALNVMRSEGYTFSSGMECVMRGEIPINAGTSSSSAMVVTWIHLLARMSDQAFDPGPAACARLAHRAEVLEFNEPGGMMDQIASAYGGVLTIRFHPSLQVGRLHPLLGTFVLGDSREPKDTTTILSRVKLQVLDIAARLVRDHDDFSLHTVGMQELDRYLSSLTPEQQDLLHGTIRNRDITEVAMRMLGESSVDPVRFGEMLNEHQAILRDTLRISTPRIDRMLDAAMEAGAYGGKINGSGGGGCMFVYAPEHAGRVAEAIERCGGRAYIVHADEGTRVENA
jgi:galactokinase